MIIRNENVTLFTEKGTRLVGETDASFDCAWLSIGVVAGSGLSLVGEEWDAFVRLVKRMDAAVLNYKFGRGV